MTIFVGLGIKVSEKNKRSEELAEMLEKYNAFLKKKKDLDEEQATKGKSVRPNPRPSKDDILNENLRRLELMDRYKKRLRSIDEKDKASEAFVSSGENTFISYDDLEEIAKKGKEFFLPPTSTDPIACLSCGNGQFYKGTLDEIRSQLESDFKNEPNNQKILAGLSRLNQELDLSAKPENEIDSDKAPTPFSIKPIY